MKVIIAGAGEVGFHIAKLLAAENQDTVVIDSDINKLKHLSSHLDVSTVHGNCSSHSVLTEAGISKADLLVAVTSIEQTNLLTAIIAKHMGVKRTLARIGGEQILSSSGNGKFSFDRLGIDELISPELLAADEIKNLLKGPSVTDTFDFDEGLLSLVGICIEENSPLRDKMIDETRHLNPNSDFLCVALLRNNKTIIPRSYTQFELGDHAYFIAQRDAVQTVVSLSGKEARVLKNIMILGGSKIGINAAKILQKNYHVKLVEIDKEKCFELSEMLPKTLVINGDCRDVELLEEEGLNDMDAFIAVTGNTETNMISSLVAKNHEVDRTITLVENMDYIHLSQNIGVDTMINKKLIAANSIIRYIREGDVLTMTSLHGADAEILEFEVKPSSKITGDIIRNLGFPKSAVLGGIIRAGKGHTPLGDFQVLAGDHVVVFSTSECISEVESFFK